MPFAGRPERCPKEVYMNKTLCPQHAQAIQFRRCAKLSILLTLTVAAYGQTKLLTTPRPIPGQYIVVMQDTTSFADIDKFANHTANYYSGPLQFFLYKVI